MHDSPAGAPGSNSSNGLFRRLPARYVLLSIILLVALALRLYGINWDNGGLFHPDERAILSNVYDLEAPREDQLGDLFNSESPLNPGWFNYGSLPIYVLKAVQWALDPFTDVDIFDLRFPGRAISLLADLATILIAYSIGARFFSKRTGLLAATLIGLAVIHIQLSHFFAFDGILTAFIVASVYFSINVAREGRTRDSILAGLMLGFALATKVSAAPLVIPVVVGHALYAFSPSLDRADAPTLSNPASARRQWIAYKGVILSGFTAMVALFVTQPYMLFDSVTFISNVTEQSEMVRRVRDYPYTRQYIDTAKFLYQATQLGVWGLGPVLGLLSWLSLALGVIWTVRHRRKSDVVIMSWVIPYFLITGWFDVKFMRYMLPLVPFLALYAARTLWVITDYLKPRLVRSNRTWLAYAPIAIILLFTVHYAFSFVAGVYGSRHTAFAASEWLSENAAPNSSIVQEHWEEGIPRKPGLVYVHDRLGVYDDDYSPQMYEGIFDLLSGSDYLVFFSNRMYATIPRLPERYPLGARYYEAVFNGELGFELAHNSSRTIGSFGISYREDPFARVPFGPPDGYANPTNGSLAINLGWADESFSVYDHPEVLVFENTGRLSQSQMLEVIGLGSGASIPDRGPGLMLSADRVERQQSGGTWTDVAYLRGLPDWLSWLPWLIALELFALAALPFAFVAFRSFPDRGYLFAKPLGLLLASTVTWLLASLAWVPFGSVGAFLGIVVIAGLSAGIVWRQRRDLRSFLKNNRRRLIAMELLFLLAFFAFLAIRAANPDMWHPWRGGEKPMDFAYLNAVVRSTVMPPYDPWFAGGYLNYYYFGQFITANIIRLTGIDPAVAYNLAVPTFFALTIAGSFSIAYSLVWLTVRARGGRPERMRSPWVAGVLAALLVAVAGNIDGLVQLIQGMPGGQFDFWRSSRMMEPGSRGNEITEFPFFSFLFADLHAHMMAIPFAILATGLGVAFIASAGRGRTTLGTWTGLFALGVTTGSLRAMNTWDFPTQLLVAGALVGGGELLLNTRISVYGRLALAAARLLFVLVVGYVVFLPFHVNFELFNSGVVASETRTPLWRYFGVHSVFVYVLLGWLGFVLFAMRRNIQGALRRGASVIEAPAWFIPFAVVALLAALATFVFTTFGTIAFTLLLAIGLVLVALAMLGMNRPDARYVAVAASMAAIGLAVGAGVDVLTLKDDIGRMNTVFKFYLQAWWLLAIASAFFVWWLWSAGPASLPRSNIAGKAWTLGLVVLLAGVAVYPVLGTQVRIRDRFDISFQSLDGMAYMENTVHIENGEPLVLEHDRRAIEWLQRNVDGSPVIVEGIADLYRWGNRVSIYTGLPAVIGWDWHQRQQRVAYSSYVAERRRDVDNFYRATSTQVAANFLEQYNVRYVIVGELERVLYPSEGLVKFDEMESLGLRPVYDSGPVKIYEFDPVESMVTDLQ